MMISYPTPEAARQKYVEPFHLAHCCHAAEQSGRLFHIIATAEVPALLLLYVPRHVVASRCLRKRESSHMPSLQRQQVGSLVYSTCEGYTCMPYLIEAVPQAALVLDVMGGGLGLVPGKYTTHKHYKRVL